VSAFLVSYQTAASFSPDRFNAVPVGATARMRVLLVCLEPGQFIPVHHPGVDITIVVLEGAGRVVAGDREEDVRSGAVAVIPAGEARGLLATARLIVLTVVTPPPTEQDHAEVAVGLRRGRWR
jgi:quercetin dioxygenase-like cupin family protein